MKRERESAFMRSRQQQEPGWELGMLREPNACGTGSPEAAQTRLLPSGSALASGGVGKRQGLPSSAKLYTTSHGQARYLPPIMRTVRLSQAVTFVHRQILGLAIKSPERLGGKTGISLGNHGRRIWNSIVWTHSPRKCSEINYFPLSPLNSHASTDCVSGEVSGAGGESRTRTFLGRGILTPSRAFGA